MKILFQGDSITDAFRRPEEENTAFQLGNGYVFLLAARLAYDFPARDFRFINRGVSGNDVRQLLARWEEDALALRPDMLSLLNGINDTLKVMTQSPKAPLDDATFYATYRELLNRLREANPAIRFVILEPYLLEAGPVTREWLDHLRPRQAGVHEIAREYDALFIPLQSLFDAALRKAPAAYWAYDGVHATHAGFQLIADAWLRTVGPTL